MQALIAARLDTLSADRKSLLQDAAVIGKVFWAGALARMGERDPRDVELALHEVVLRLWSPGPVYWDRRSELKWVPRQRRVGRPCRYLQHVVVTLREGLIGHAGHRLDELTGLSR